MGKTASTATSISGLNDIYLHLTSALQDDVHKFLDYQESINNSPATITQYSWQLSRMIEFMGDGCLSEIDDDMIIGFQLWLKKEKKLAPITVLNTRRALNAFLNWAAKRGMIQDNPAGRVKKPKVPKRILPPISQSDVEIIMRSFKGRSPMAVRDRAMFAVWLDTGMRRTEIASLTVGHIGSDSSQLIVTGKGSKDRIVFLGETARRYLKAYTDIRSGKPSDPLWLSYRGPLTSDGFRRWVDKLREKTGVQFTSHDIRRTFAIMSLRNGADLLSVSKQLGHAEITTTTIYLDQCVEDLARVHAASSPVDGLKQVRLGNLVRR